MSSELNKISKFIQENSPDGALNHTVQGEFLQSEEWRKFQEAFGKKTHHVESLGGGASKLGFWANVIEHELPIVGKPACIARRSIAGRYFYIPRGPIIGNLKSEIRNSFSELVDLARKNNVGWIRFDANNSSILDLIRKNWRVIKAPHDMQPREILVVDITKPEEQLLSEMKAKTRYNIKVAQKHEISLRITNLYETTNNKNIEDFLRLMKITSERDKITPHPESYYRKMFKTIPGNILKLYVAEYEKKIIAANIVIFYGNTATYLHGASDYEYRNLMAPYLLHWQAILDAKKAGTMKYDLGGVKSCNMQHETCNRKWEGITRFKTSFSPNTQPIIFPGSYDIVINSKKYNLYRFLQKIRGLF